MTQREQKAPKQRFLAASATWTASLSGGQIRSWGCEGLGQETKALGTTGLPSPQAQVAVPEHA